MIGVAQGGLKYVAKFNVPTSRNKALIQWIYLNIISSESGKNVYKTH